MCVSACLCAMCLCLCVCVCQCVCRCVHVGGDQKTSVGVVLWVLSTLTDLGLASKPQEILLFLPSQCWYDKQVPPDPGFSPETFWDWTLTLTLVRRARISWAISLAPRTLFKRAISFQMKYWNPRVCHCVYQKAITTFPQSHIFWFLAKISSKLFAVIFPP